MGQAPASSIFPATSSSLGLTHTGGSQYLLADERMSMKLLNGKNNVSRRAGLLGFLKIKEVFSYSYMDMVEKK